MKPESICCAGATGAIVWVALGLGGCAGPRPEGGAAAMQAAHVADLENTARSCPIFDGRDGSPLDWETMVARACEADVVILGELHDDAVGHAIQHALLREVLAACPGTALSMEMLERDQQALIDDYLDGIIDAGQFTELTFSERWGGATGSWEAWYLPIIDAARQAGAAVVAANAPRRYVRLANRDYERLEALAGERRELFRLPLDVPFAAYRERFESVMAGHDEEAGSGMGDSSALDGMFRAQLIWDATMAGSIVEALDHGARKVVHLVGQFHSDFNGATVQHVTAWRPGTRMLIISLQRVHADELREDDRDRADIVVYTLPPAP